MNYYSLNHIAPNTTFENAVIKGLAPDRGLYFPESITPLEASFFETIETLSNEAIAFEAIKQFISPEIPEDVLKTIVSETLSFDFPVVNLTESISTLELFHGPTMAFKDVGARFMARCLGCFNKDNSNEVTVLVATSGDTGGAVANGFLGVKGVRVVILYPSGKVSDIQEKQLTTLGQNITALEVEGTFDDCQDMVKKAFLDDELTSTNAINICKLYQCSTMAPPTVLFYVCVQATQKQFKRDCLFGSKRKFWKCMCWNDCSKIRTDLSNILSLQITKTM